MTDRIKGCTVVFEEEIRTDDAESILNAIRSIRGVLSVDGTLSTGSDYFERQRIKIELLKKISQMVVDFK